MEFRILGPFEVVEQRPRGLRGVTGRLVLPRGRGRALLALLVLHAGEVVAADRLIDELWGPTPPATATKGLHNLISDLRRRLGSGVDPAAGASSALVTSGPGYALRIDPEQVDANRFRRLLDEASGARPDVRAARLRSALELWRGPALVDFAYEPFAQAEIAVLEELRLAAIEERVDAELALGRQIGLVGELEGLVAEHPFRERLRAQLMLALYQCGRQADALDVYQAGRRALVEDLGIEPGPALTGLERAILRQDPSLEPAGEPVREGGKVDPGVGAEPWLGAERKTVTVVYAELAESIAAGDPELVRRLHARCVEVATEVLGRHGGTVQGLIGGIVVAVFGVPTAREDDALRAARAAVELREAVKASSVPESERDVATTVRAGITTGEVVVADPATGPAAASGDAVKSAARLQQAAAEGEVLVDEATRELLGEAARIESAAALVIDRRGRPDTVWRLVEVAADAPARTPDRGQRLVGRTGELTRLHAALQRARRQKQASRLTVIGEAGVGKSRLALEFAATVAAEVRVFSCRCPSYGKGITFWPLRELVLQAAGGGRPEDIAELLAGQDDADTVATQVAGAIGLSDEPGTKSELFPSVRRLVEALASERPMAVVVDDVQWAQPTFIDLVDYLTESVQAPLLVVCLARPELLDERPEWVAERGDATGLVLEPLGPDDSERMVAHRLAGRLVPEDVVTQVVAMAQGNPLFIEQLLAALRDHGKLGVPPSVHALLAARLDRLGPAERDLLRCAAVIGTEFSLAAVTALTPVRSHRFLVQHLDALHRKEFVRPARHTFLGQQGFTFRHVLIQEAAYRSATREARAELHQQLADWLDRREAPELDEVVAYHLEQAYQHRRELGLADGATHELSVRAGERLARCGLRAYQWFDMTAAENLLSRARTLLPAEHPQRYEVLQRLAQAFPTLGRLADAEGVLVEMLEDPRTRLDPRHEQRLRLEQLRVRLIAGPDPVRHDAIRAEVQLAVEALEPLGDEVGMSQACYLLATVHLRAGEMRELEVIGRRGLEHARRSGDLRELLGALWWPSWALVAGATPVEVAIRSCQELSGVAGVEHPGVLTDLARLKAMIGEFDAARGLIARARRQVVERVRVRRALSVLARRSAEVEILAGEPDAAERILRAAIEVGLDVAERDQTSQLAAELSRILSARRATEEAGTFASLSRQHAPAESVAAQALWRSASARVLALGEQAQEAERLAREAIALVPTELLNLRADLHVDLAATLLLAGRHRAARSALREATELYERKGNLSGAANAGKLATELLDGSRRAGRTSTPDGTERS